MDIRKYICCDNCFADEEIINIIRAKNNIGNCQFCKNTDGYVYDLSKYEELTNLMNAVIELYSPMKFLSSEFPTNKLSLIKDALHNNWDIFNVNSDIAFELLTVICKEKYAKNKELFNDYVGMDYLSDFSYLARNSILGGANWDDFVYDIKYRNRFHTKIVNLDIFATFLKNMQKIYTSNDKFYRARISHNSSGYDDSQMGAPPSEKATAGRISPEGIPCLYLSDNEKTTIHETRAFLHDYVTIATFYPLDKIKVVDLSNMGRLSPFILSDSPTRFNIPLDVFSVNIGTLKKIDDEISKPQRRNDTHLDYLSTQFICDFIKSKGYAGIEYKSTVDNGGKNIAIFDPELLECKGSKVVKITDIHYDLSEI